MKRFLSLFLLIMCFTLVSGSFNAVSAKEVAQYRWKMATLAPDGVGWAKHIKSVVFPAIKEATNGNLVVKTYWGGVMGDEEEYIKKMRIGQLQGAGFAGQGTVLVCPEIAVLTLPFLFNNYAEVDYIKKKMSPTFDGLMKQNGYYMLFLADQDFDQVISTKKPLAKLEDFKGVRFIEWYGAIEVSLLQSLGAQPIRVQVPEIASSIRLGTCEAAIGPSLWIVGSQLHTTVKYINPLKIRYSPSLIAITIDTWHKLPEEYRKEYFRIRERVMGEYGARVREDNAKGLEALFGYGVRKVTTSPADLEVMKKKTRAVWNSMSDDLYPRELLDEVMGYLDEFRGKGGGKRSTWSSDDTETRSEGGAHVRAVQEKLKGLGYYKSRVDGMTGPSTYWAIQRYQKAKGLAVTGGINAETLKSLGIQ
ncbi:MAG: TRAP transporter substrate-binding protein DctP [Deltaproteobacteria bacterium]|nr:TRAP transporter substrate-binding protein DctP [Deltaproteobacteria bacterium]